MYLAARFIFVKERVFQTIKHTETGRRQSPQVFSLIEMQRLLQVISD